MNNLPDITNEIKQNCPRFKKYVCHLGWLAPGFKRQWLDPWYFSEYHTDAVWNHQVRTTYLMHCERIRISSTTPDALQGRAVFIPR